MLTAETSELTAFDCVQWQNHSPASFHNGQSVAHETVEITRRAGVYMFGRN